MFEDSEPESEADEAPAPKDPKAATPTNNNKIQIVNRVRKANRVGPRSATTESLTSEEWQQRPRRRGGWRREGSVSEWSNEGVI